MFAVETNNGVTTLTLSHPPVNAISEEWIRSFDAKPDAGCRPRWWYIRLIKVLRCRSRSARAWMRYGAGIDGRRAGIQRLYARMGCRWLRPLIEERRWARLELAWL
jgi:hypothetical protein